MSLTFFGGIFIILFLGHLYTAKAGNDTLQIVSRDEWNARIPIQNATALETPVPKVVIIHTATRECTTRSECDKLLRQIQSYHMDIRKFDDIGYNFVVGGNGIVYEGRGWEKQGSHTKKANHESIGIALIGSFDRVPPPDVQLSATRLLIEVGVASHIIASNYKLYGHRQLSSTLSPGDALYGLIRTWPHWSDDA